MSNAASTASRGTKIERVVAIALFTAIVNFLVYVAVATHLGGDAINGFTADNHYYFRSHREVTEVSRRVFEYSRWHSYALFAHVGLVFILAGLVKTQKGQAPA